MRTSERWRQAWRGERELRDKHEDEPETKPQQTQWPTLLPSARPSYAAPVADGTTTDEDADHMTSGLAAISLPTVPALPVPLSNDATAGESVIAPSQPPAIEAPQPTAGGAQPVPVADKGEVIWAAEFVVAESAVNEGTPEAPPVGTPSRQAAGEQHREHEEGGTPFGKREAPEREETGPGQPPPFAEPFEHGLSHVSAPHPVTSMSAESGTAPLDPAGAIAAGGADTDGPKALRPSQVATLYVDVPGATGGEDSATMRLAVTQRGDQVNVRLRSWDAATAPIGHDRMQPLLQSLAEKGFETRVQAIDRVDENRHIAPEHLRERAMPTAETSGSNNEQQSFQNADDRQQKNQERQQSFFLRRPMRFLQTETFDLQSALDGSSSSHQ